MTRLGVCFMCRRFLVFHLRFKCFCWSEWESSGPWFTVAAHFSLNPWSPWPHSGPLWDLSHPVLQRQHISPTLPLVFTPVSWDQTSQWPRWAPHFWCVCVCVCVCVCARACMRVHVRVRERDSANRHTDFTTYLSPAVVTDPPLITSVCCDLSPTFSYRSPALLLFLCLFFLSPLFFPSPPPSPCPLSDGHIASTPA